MGVRSLSREDLEEGMASHSSILPQRLPWTEEPGGLQSLGGKELDTTEATQHTVSCICHYNIIQNSFTILKNRILFNCSTLFSPQAFTFYHHFLALFRMPYNWNNIVYSLFKLASYTQQYVLKNYPCIVYPSFIPSPTETLLGCFQFLSTLNKAATNIYVQGFVQT